MIDPELAQMGYRIDPITGFLEHDAPKTFNPREKTKFLKGMKGHGNQSKAAHVLGYTFKVVQWHLQKDPAFKEAYDETLLEMKHQLEAELYQAGRQPKGAKQAKIWLEAHYPLEYRSQPRTPPKKGEKVNTEVDKLFDKL